MAQQLDAPAFSRIVATARWDIATATAGRAVGRITPARRTAYVPTPTITVNSTGVSGISTFHQATTGGAVDRNALNPEFTYPAGAALAKLANASSSFWSGVKCRYTLATNISYGSVVVDFQCNARILTFTEPANDPGLTRLLVDGVEIAMWGAAIRANTAQAGGANNTIILDTGASTTNYNYVGRWVRIVSGTGAGQVRQITNYVGSSKTATVSANWTTNPDATSAFVISLHPIDGVAQTTLQYINLDWGFEQRMRTYRIETSNTPFYGIYTSPTDYVGPVTPSLGGRCVVVGDSVQAGTGGTMGMIDSTAGHVGRLLGWNTFVEGCIPGTGYLSDNSGTSFNARDRILPPYNSWVITQGGTAGTWTLTWNGVTTAAIAYNAATSAIQSAVDTAFGSGVFSVIASGISSNPYANVFLLGRGAAASSTATLIADFSGVTGGWKLIERWSGVVAPYVPRDGAGNPQTFDLILSLGTNDRPSIAGGSTYTPTLLYNTVRQLLLDITTGFPTARVWVVNMYNMAAWPSSSLTLPQSGEYLDVALAIRQAATEVLPKIRGTLPLIEPMNFTPTPTTLAAATAVGATTITTTAAVVAGQSIVIENGTNGEAKTVSAVSGSGPYTLTVPAMINSHAAGVNVYPLVSSWFTGTGYLIGPTNDGNADLLRAEDRVHPTPLGHMVVGSRIAQFIDATLSVAA